MGDAGSFVGWVQSGAFRGSKSLGTEPGWARPVTACHKPDRTPESGAASCQPTSPMSLWVQGGSELDAVACFWLAQSRRAPGPVQAQMGVWGQLLCTCDFVAQNLCVCVTRREDAAMGMGLFSDTMWVSEWLGHRMGSGAVGGGAGTGTTCLPRLGTCGWKVGSWVEPPLSTSQQSRFLLSTGLCLEIRGSLTLSVPQ